MLYFFKQKKQYYKYNTAFKINKIGDILFEFKNISKSTNN